MNSAAPARDIALTLIGTVHRDPQGEANLLRALEELRPDRITLEMSCAAFAYRQRHGRRLARRLGRILDGLAAETGRDREELERLRVVADIRCLLELPFEYRAAVAYGDLERVPVVLIDDSAVSAAKLQRVESELITYRNLQTLIGLVAIAKPADDIPEGYRAARTLIRQGVEEEVCRAFLDRRRGEEGIGPRDRRMAEKIRSRLRRPGHLVHIGGWVHLVDDPRGETLYTLLRDRRPRRRLLAPAPEEAEGRIPGRGQRRCGR